MGLFSFLNKRKGNSSSSRRNQRQAGRIYPVPAGAPAADAYAFNGSVDEYFNRILNNCFPGYTVRTAPTNPGLNTGKSGCSCWLLCRDGSPRAAILLVDKNRWHTADILDTMRDFNQKRIPCLRFIRQFRNQAGYILERINGILR